MKTTLDKYKGVHPGIVLDREIKKRGIKQRALAHDVKEYPQILNAILKGKRSINISLALKLERTLGLEEGTLVFLQAHYDIRIAKEKESNVTPNLDLLNKSLFWDTKIESINWQKQYVAVIQRVFERGNEEAKSEIIRFYGEEKVKSVLNSKHNNRKPYTVYSKP